MVRWLIAALVLAFCGCGPMHQPMVERLDDEGQAEVDAAWNRALQPVESLDRQLWLDVMVTGQVYQVGIDRLSFRSEKDFAGGMVAMTIRFDRTKPEQDEFKIQVFDQSNQVLRSETYSRDDVETTQKFLFPGHKKTDSSDSLEKKELDLQREQRLSRVAEVFPSDENPISETGAKAEK